MVDPARILPFRSTAVLNDAAEPAVESARYKGGMRRLASGVSIVTTELGGVHYGMAATSVTSVSAEPPTLLVCIAKSASSHAAIRESGRFCVNVLGEADRDVADRFATEKDRSARFAGRNWTSLVTGAPALPGCLASFDCVIAQELGAASHTVFFGRVVETRLWDAKISPLLFWDGAFREPLDPSFSI
ncbi:flavin reductase family protein [Terrihabitans rhizophilus]|uniref:Flavin reductase family protein n=1 Tax=Terrihabitans rhizophilus TaxID=3092662 RepID=A0ABU4RHX0_9HYPH|nr:flavin reductase family protein [Terrihabitans sp. PJ23]MDX6804437.1 flavin reductase family protein [Terrihabitans sp. PJ23]